MKKVKFDDAMLQLEDMLSRLEAGDMGLEDAVKLYEKAMELVVGCQQVLTEAEGKVRLLTEEISRTDPSMLTGRGDPARPVHFSGDPSLIGSFVDVEITEAGAFSLTGKIV